MDTHDCIIGESLIFGDDIRIQLTGRADGQLYVFIDASRLHKLEGSDGFHASAPCGHRHRAHILALRDGDKFGIGPICVQVESVRVDLSGAQALRDVRLRIQAPMSFARNLPERLRRRLRQRVEGEPCWS